jgi:hypothetical protein
MLNIDKYIKQIEKYLETETHNNWDLKKVLNKLKEYKAEWKTKFPLYWKKVYSPNIDKNTFIDSTLIALKDTISSRYNIISEEKLKEDALNCSKIEWKSKSNDAYIVEKDWLFRMYYFRNWILKWAFLISPWKKDWRWGWYSKTEEWSFILWELDVNHISSAFRWFKIKNWKIIWWSMLISRNFNLEWQAVHIWSEITWKRESHWCVRMFPKDAILLSQYDNIKLHVLDS